MPAAKNSRKLKLNRKFVPIPTSEDDEIFLNGIFHFNISKLLEHLETGKLDAEKMRLNVKEWFKGHMHCDVNEEHLPNVDVTKPILLGEIMPGGFNIIDGNHRLEKAYRDGVEYIDSYKIPGEQLIPYFKDFAGYEAFIGYWNEKVKMDADKEERLTCSNPYV